jgi:multiple sugar transport system ATP-binding protein
VLPGSCRSKACSAVSPPSSRVASASALPWEGHWCAIPRFLFDEPRTVYDRPANMFVAGFMGSPSMNFMPAQIAVSGPAAVVLMESEGQAMRLPLPREVATSVVGGRRVVLGIRPENLTRYDRRWAEESPYLGTIEAPVEVVEPTGAETIVIVRIGSREVIARFEPNAAPAVGEKVTLAVDMAKACLFDPETEMLV